MTKTKSLNICEKCGQTHSRCSGHRQKKRTSEGNYIPCGNQPIKGNSSKKCRNHGGLALSGVKHPRFKHGRFSKYLPDDLNFRLHELNESRKAGEFLSLEHQIKLVEVRLSQIEEKLGSGDSEKTWREVKEAKNEIQIALKSGNKDKIISALQKLNLNIDEGMEEYRSWNELFKAQKQYAKLISSERKKMIEDRYMISIDDVMILLSMIVYAIQESVPDERVRRKLVDEIKIISRKSGFTD